MPMKLSKYVGAIVEIIYLDSRGRLTHRTVQIHSIQGDILHAYCYHRQAPRSFKLGNVLAAQPLPRKSRVS
jgi:predicted DNA-binding transcriptional regulator YafY